MIGYAKCFKNNNNNNDNNNNSDNNSSCKVTDKKTITKVEHWVHKNKTYRDKINFNFQRRKVPKQNTPCKCLSLIMLDFVFGVNTKYYPQTVLGEWKFETRLKWKILFMMIERQVHLIMEMVVRLMLTTNLTMNLTMNNLLMNLRIRSVF